MPTLQVFHIIGSDNYKMCCSDPDWFLSGRVTLQHFRVFKKEKKRGK